METRPLQLLISLCFLLCFLIGYLFLPKDMWSYYFKDTQRFGIMAALFFIIFIPMLLFSSRAPWGFLGFWLMDPISFRMVFYPRLKREELLRKKLSGMPVNPQ